MEIQTEQPPSLLLSLGNQKIGRINHLLSVTIFAMKVLIEQEYIIKLQTRWQTHQFTALGRTFGRSRHVGWNHWKMGWRRSRLRLFCARSPARLLNRDTQTVAADMAYKS